MGPWEMHNTGGREGRAAELSTGEQTYLSKPSWLRELAQVTHTGVRTHRGVQVPQDCCVLRIRGPCGPWESGRTSWKKTKKRQLCTAGVPGSAHIWR